MNASDQALIARVLLDRDTRAFTTLVRQHQSAVRSFLRRLTAGRHALADDLAQETFIEAWQKLDRYRGDAAFASWLLGIAYNRFRSARRQERPTEEWTEAVHAGSATGELADEREANARHQDVQAAVATLEPDERAAIHLCFASGLSHSEAAGVLGVPLGTLKTAIARAKGKLRERLRAWSPA